MTALFHDLLKPVSRSFSLLAAIFGLIGCTIKALSLLFLRVNYQAETIAMVLFGIYAILKGWLVFRSTFLPRILGVLSVVGGLGWLTYLCEPLAVRLLPYILAVAFVGAVSSVVWLLVFGVNEGRWKEQARASAGSIWR